MIALTIIALFAIPFASALLNNSMASARSLAQLHASEFAFSILEEVAVTREFFVGTNDYGDRYRITTTLIPEDIPTDEETKQFIEFFRYSVTIVDLQSNGAKAELSQLFGRRRS